MEKIINRTNKYEYKTVKEILEKTSFSAFLLISSIKLASVRFFKKISCGFNIFKLLLTSFYFVLLSL